jgi:hypothetical protein
VSDGIRFQSLLNRPMAASPQATVSHLEGALDGLREGRVVGEAVGPVVGRGVGISEG